MQLQDEQQTALLLARQGDAGALGRLIEDLRPYLKQQVAGVRRRRALARFDDSDVVQDAALAALQGFAGFRGVTMAEFARWLQTIVIRATLHAVARHQGVSARAVERELSLEELVEQIHASDPPDVKAVRQEQAAVLAGAVERLPREMQFVLLARHQDNLPHADIADRLGRTVTAVRALYVRALRRLKEECAGQISSLG